MRVTKQREVMLEELRRLTSHPTADELYALVRRQLPHVSLGTVYRNLDVLSRQGLIQKMAVSGGQTRYDGNVERHDHVRCVRCGRVLDIPLAPVSTVRLPEAPPGFVISGYSLEFLGLCRECRE